jgi:hypothetical protein
LTEHCRQTAIPDDRRCRHSQARSFERPPRFNVVIRAGLAVCAVVIEGARLGIRDIK